MSLLDIFEGVQVLYVYILVRNMHTRTCICTMSGVYMYVYTSVDLG